MQNHNLVENLVIIGSGPAGYTAAIYAARANLKPILVTGFKSGGIPGGQLMTTTYVENFPGFPNGIKGPELMDMMKAQAVRWGTELVEADVEEANLESFPFTLKVNGQFLKTNSLIIATGASANRLNLPDEEKFWSKGISACAICDGATPQFKNEELAVAGGGDSACEEAIYLTKYGSHIHLFVRSNQLKASQAMADRVIDNNQVSIHWNSEIIELKGNDWLKTIKVRNNNKLIEEEIDIKGLFYAIGHTPNTSFISGQLNIDNHGYIITKPGRPETSIEGIYAAGDVADSEWKQGITAASSGCKAALATERWLSKKGLAKLYKRDNLNPKETKPKEKIQISTKDNYDLNAKIQKGSYALRKLYHEADRPILVIYTSSNCGPCYVLKPTIYKVINELKGKIQGIEIDIELEEEIAQQAGVTGTPTVHLFENKILKEQWKGVKQYSELAKRIKELIAKK